MPTVSVRDNLQYFYTDSGVPKASNYKTIILIHGHTFHSGIFKRLLPLAVSRSLRLICPNRREYPGTTPFSPAELKIFSSGTEEERTKLIEKQGTDLGLFVDALIKQCDLPKDGGVTIAAWSMGNIFLLSLLSSINLLPAGIKATLQTYVKGVVMWDPPSHVLGITSPPGSYVPLWDESLAPEARGPAFGIWAASYWKHGDLSTHDISQFNYRDAEKSKKPSTESMGPEIPFLADFTAGDKCETVLVSPEFVGVLSRQTNKALFDPTVRKAWAATSVTHMYGDANTWNIIYSHWILEDKAKSAGTSNTPINFKVVEGANHFFMWEEPEAALDNLHACM